MNSRLESIFRRENADKGEGVWKIIEISRKGRSVWVVVDDRGVSHGKSLFVQDGAQFFIFFSVLGREREFKVHAGLDAGVLKASRGRSVEASLTSERLAVGCRRRENAGRTYLSHFRGCWRGGLLCHCFR